MSGDPRDSAYSETAPTQAMEAELYQLALELRGVPVDTQTHTLHLRALDLKREVSSWHGKAPEKPRAAAVRDEIAYLRSEAARWRADLRSGRERTCMVQTRAGCLGLGRDGHT
jgi:hypothetical protein